MKKEVKFNFFYMTLHILVHCHDSLQSVLIFKHLSIKWSTSKKSSAEVTCYLEALLDSSGSQPMPLLTVSEFISSGLLLLSVVHGLPQSPQRSEVKVKFTLEQATKAQRGSRGIALFFL
jgi:hypothetical protein